MFKFCFENVKSLLKLEVSGKLPSVGFRFATKSANIGTLF